MRRLKIGKKSFTPKSDHFCVLCGRDIKENSVFRWAHLIGNYILDSREGVMYNNDMTNNIAEAIRQSITEDRIVAVRGTLAGVEEYARTHGYETDSAPENNGRVGVWGWTSETPEGEQDWRIEVVES